MENYVNWFRTAAPYINAHKGKTVVLAFGGDAITDERFAAIVHDIAILSTLGLKIVLVHGAGKAMDATLPDPGISEGAARGRRAVSPDDLERLTGHAGLLRARVEALLSMGIANSPMHGARIRVCGGNFVIAQPLGVHGGTDFGHAGRVRRIDREGMSAELGSGNIVLLSPLGYSTTGEIFYLGRDEVAVAAATTLGADKLVFLEDTLLTDASGTVQRDLPLRLAQMLAAESPSPVLDAAIVACQGGVERCYVLDYRHDGALLCELYTRDGIGSMVNRDSYESIRVAGIEDVGGIMELIGPLERDGTLVRRSRERLELEIDCFSVVERDGAIIACAALYADTPNRSGELACVATDPGYRRSGRANRLLEHIENRAREAGLDRLFVLTTRTAHWFVERGFRPTELANLPEKRRELYNYQRNSQVFIKDI